MSKELPIRAVLNLLAPHVVALEDRAASAPVAARPLVLDSLQQLREVIEELHVTEEELRLQAEDLATTQAESMTGLAWYRTLFLSATVPIVVTDGGGTILEINPAASALLGIGEHDARQKPLAVFVGENARVEFRSRVRGVGRTPGPARWRLELTPRHATPIVAEVEASIVPAVPGREQALYWSIRDVTLDAHTERMASEAVEGLRALLQHAPVPLVATDVDGTITLWNSEAERLLGWTRHEAVGHANPAFATAEDGVGSRCMMAATRKDGSTVQVGVSTTPLAGPGGRQRGTISVLSPVRTQEDEESEERPQATAEAPRIPGADRRTALRHLLKSAPGTDVLERLRNAIASGIHLGYLEAGDRLPSIREVADATGADHRVVTSAYRVLGTDGVVEVRSRHGTYVAAPVEADSTPLAESAEWLAGVLAEACALQIKVGALPDLVRRWTASRPVRCACVESSNDELVSLQGELRQQWGLDTYAVRVGEGPVVRGRGRSEETTLVSQIREADLVVTTPFHSREVAVAARALGRPMVVIRANPEVVEAMESALKERTLTAVVTESEYGERLRSVRGGERLRVVLTDDEAAVTALDPSEPVLLTRAARERLGSPRLRLLVPPSAMIGPASASGIAEALVRANQGSGVR